MWFKPILTVILVGVFVSPTTASIKTIEIGGAEYSSSGANSVASDAVVLSFNDGISDDYVRLTIQFNGGTGVDSDAKLALLNFNVDATSITKAVWIEAESFTRAKFDYDDPLVEYYNPDSFGSPASGFDFDFTFPRSNKADFEVGEKVVYDIYGSGSGTAGKLLADDFLTQNTDTNYLYYATVQLLSVDGGNSGKYGSTGFGGDGDPVPEPGTIAIWSMIGLGAVGGATWRRRKNSKVA